MEGLSALGFHLYVDQLADARINGPQFAIARSAAPETHAVRDRNAIRPLDRRRPRSSELQRATFTFYEGDPISLTGQHGFSANEPILIPLSRLIQVTALKQFLRRRRMPDTDLPFWEPYFQRADSLLVECLNIIRSGSANALNELRNADRQVEELFHEVAPAEFARSNGLELVPPLLTTPARHLTEVSFRITPPHAQLHLVEATSYALAEFLGEEPPWTEVVSFTQRLGGRYRYRVSWPDGVMREDVFVVGPESTTLEIRQ